MKKYFLKKYNTLLVLLLSALGILSSCDKNNGGGIQAEYGCPNADFIVKGCIASDSTGAKIKNIKVVSQDSVYSDLAGNYILIMNAFPENQTFTLHFKDVDSTDNGSYQNLDTTISFQNPQFTNGDGDWYEGQTTKELNVKLNLK
ncbi:MAG TPA: radical SAM-associated putative lipoprotein [Bacteroidales bacterium]|nr:radical SAM-associated putative lipoprotein [Bacteroidales bacterium]HPS18468.1 radical SAM-associated putative lipoprotein [Bacteroidales bacterium]